MSCPSADRRLTRFREFLQIVVTLGAILWGGYKLVRSFDETLQLKEQVEILQRQMSTIQGLLTDYRRK